MRLFPISLLALAAFVLADADDDNSSVIGLTAGNFQDAVRENPLMLVEFFAPWCGHCKALAPHYAEAATALKEKDIPLATVNCVDEADLCQTHGIQGYPSLKVYKNGEPSEYKGPRQAEGIISYMVKQSLPAVSEVSSANYEDFKKADRLVVIAYLPTSTSAPAPELSALAEKLRDDYLFGLVTDEDIIKSADVEAPMIVAYRTFDEPTTNYPYPVTDATAKEIEEWLRELAIPVIDEVNAENYGIYAGSQKPLAYLFLDSAAEGNDALIEAIRPIAKKWKSKVNFVHIDAVKFADHAKALNIPEAKWPAFVVQNLEKQLKYPLDQSTEATPERISDWVEKYILGKIEPTLKSQPIPSSQDEAVYTLVGKSFDEAVFDDSKDVFVEFYASWCGHCKRLAPTWESIAEKYADRKDQLLIAKMEAMDNDLPASVNFRIQGFPTLKFKPAGSRDFIDYEGDRSMESLVAFIEEHAKNALTPKVVSEDAQIPMGGGNSNNASESQAERHDEL